MIIRLLLALLLLVLALRVFMTRRGRLGPRPLGDWLHIAALALLAIPLLLGRGVIFLAVLGAVLLVLSQVLVGWQRGRQK